MLKMKCPKCDEMIVSALLSDMEQIPCEHCNEIVPVANVLVFAEGFTFHRNDLLKRLFRYKSLLDEINKERELLDRNPQASEESKKSLESFSQALVEVMAGARNNLRIDFTEPIPLRYHVNCQIEIGVLTNLSMSGACIEIESHAVCPRKKSVLTVEFSLPSHDYKFTLKGVVSWVKRRTSFGLEFNPLEQQDVDALWRFISSAVKS